MVYNELEQRGTADFPVDFFYIDSKHPRYYMRAHWHNEIEIIRIVKGELEIKLNNNEYTAKEGDILFLNSETVHHAEPKNCVYECIVFHINFLFTDMADSRLFIEGMLNGEYIIQEYHPFEVSEFHLTANEIFDLFKNKTLGYKFRFIAAIYKLFGVILDKELYQTITNDKAVSGKKSIMKLKKILSFIRENYDKQISLEDMAKEAEFSIKYFGAYFKNMTDKTPFDYLNEYRIEKAARMLLISDMSVTDIAYSCGFNDLSYFIKTFKKINKLSPGKYRKKIKLLKSITI
ncbi:MAG: AraC family transcriptional regulator [Clostridia bacterium]|nr:AraC family transcriptional regulator [Clostridia bacterium]